jgi:Ca-activated chloride channel homolog
VPRFAVAVLLVLGIHPVPAQDSQRSVFRSGTSVVAVNVSVTDRKNHFVGGLTRDDFALFEDGVQQDIRFFEATQTPLDLIVLIDTSSSMTDKMQTVHRAAIGFLETLREGDRGAVVAFSDRVQIVEPLTGDGDRLAEAVRETRASGGTALHDALYVALRQFGAPAGSDDSDRRRRAIAVLSDGQDTASLLSFDDVMDLARRSGVGIYTIGLRSPARVSDAERGLSSQAQYALKSLSEETGAEAYFPSQVSELEDVYSSIATELSHQYAMGYVPRKPGTDGGYRQIAVRIPTRPELRPKARRGYIAGTKGP